MPSAIARGAATRVSSGVAAVPRINNAEEQIVIPWLTQLALEGRVFVAGHGSEETATDGEAALDETTPTFILMAPASGTIILPIWAEFRMHAEGGAAPDAYLTYVGVDRTVGLSGTDLDKMPVGRLAGDAVTSAAICKKTVSSVTAITDAQNVLLARRANVLDNQISVESATTRASIETFERDPLALKLNFIERFNGAFVLSGGQSIHWQTGTGTSDSTYTVTFFWAELPSSIYIP